MDDYVTKDEFHKECKGIEDKIDDLKENDLHSIWLAIEVIFKDIGNLRWFIVGGFTILGIVLALLKLFS